MLQFALLPLYPLDQKELEPLAELIDILWAAGDEGSGRGADVLLGVVETIASMEMGIVAVQRGGVESVGGGRRPLPWILTKRENGKCLVDTTTPVEAGCPGGGRATATDRRRR